MLQLIENFPKQIDEAIEIGLNYDFKLKEFEPQNIVICGLGGSGIGANFVKDVVYSKISIPLEIVKGYTLPAYVSEKTLVIISSYSGNTEETVACLEEAVNRNARVVGISSNGKVKELCLEHDLDFIEIPGGMPPRACFGYSTIQLFRVATYFNLIEDNYREEFEGSAALIESFNAELDQSALALAEELADKIPVLYAADTIESVAIRWRQQINENGKQLCWHHVVPEMNHNELVGWRQKNEKLAVVFLRNEDDLKQVAKRMDLNAEVYKQYTPHIIEIWSKGKNFIETSSYLIQFGDYLSYHLSQLRGFDTTEVKVIDALKANLKNA
ncbi:MAG: bifunctional phosphoglucose/phosphomannose isomerase [Bacteroidetes bacterium]|nr:bifunctional phosphoglucose/phosphomannose isomerase [Bacteroidota bacterium]